MDKPQISSEEFYNEIFKKAIKFVKLWGCGQSPDMMRCINRMLEHDLKYYKEQNKKHGTHGNAINYVQMLIDHKFAYRLKEECRRNPKPLYKTELGIPDKKYKQSVKDAKWDKEMSKLRWV